MRRLVAVFGVLIVGTSLAFAGPISDIGLFNTGVNGSGVALTSGSDGHYQVVLGGSGAAAVVTSNAPSVAPYNWIAANGTSAWISPNSNAAFARVDSDTTISYTTTFDLTGYVLSSVVITGSWAVDNLGEIYLNAQTTTPVASIADQLLGASFNTFSGHGFTINNSSPGGLIQGVNTLTFRTTNLFLQGFETQNSTGVRVEFSPTFEGTLQGIPEPGTMALLGGGLLALGLFRRRTAR